jgi:hypothetical protein
MREQYQLIDFQQSQGFVTVINFQVTKVSTRNDILFKAQRLKVTVVSERIWNVTGKSVVA